MSPNFISPPSQEDPASRRPARAPGTQIFLSLHVFPWWLTHLLFIRHSLRLLNCTKRGKTRTKSVQRCQVSAYEGGRVSAWSREGHWRCSPSPWCCLVTLWTIHLTFNLSSLTNLLPPTGRKKKTERKWGNFLQSIWRKAASHFLTWRNPLPICRGDSR